MSSHFCLSVTLLDATYHGRRDDGVPEWPPSPLRAFQSLVAAASARRQTGQLDGDPEAAFEWLEGLGPPEIVAPPGRLTTRPYLLYVPNNAGDLLGSAWLSGRRGATMASEKHLTEKYVWPTRLVGGDMFTGGNVVRFLWPMGPTPAGDAVACLSQAARSLTHLGWGVDMAAGHGAAIDESRRAELLGDRRLERWSPGSHGTPLRVPQPESPQGPSTFRSLTRRHEQFLRRMSGGRPQDVPPLTDFRIVGYSRAIDPPPRPLAAFAILKPDANGFSLFNTQLKTGTVAGMVRHAVSHAVERAGSWSPKKFATFVHGHTTDGRAIRGEKPEPRLSYLPLPSLEQRGDDGDHVGTIRRVLIAGPPDAASEVAFIRRTLSGQPLIEEERNEPKALLSGIRESDRDWRNNVRRYVDPSSTWFTVTPVLLPGYDDGGPAKAERLLRKAFRQAGLAPELADNAAVELRKVGFRPGVEHANRYKPPQNLKHWPRYHVRVRWRDANGNDVPVPGPLAVGTGRHRGFGLFAAEG